MSYRVFNKDDHNTWPELNCPILVFKPNEEWPHIYQWDPNGHCFLDNYESYYPKKCLYQYIGYMPYIVEELHPVQCAYLDEDGNGIMCPYGFDDDGYCLCDDGFKCKHQFVATEYEIKYKSIWKDY